MDNRIELLKARITLYRRYLREGVDGDLARAYLWLIHKDETEIAAIAKNLKKEAQTRTKAVGSERSQKTDP
jgi:hypothetical protein